MTFRVDLSHQAAKDLKRLDRTTAKRVQDRIEELASDPLFPRFSKQMETVPEKRYSRVGDWRIISTCPRPGWTPSWWPRP